MKCKLSEYIYIYRVRVYIMSCRVSEHIYIYIYIVSCTGWQRPIGCLTFTGHFPQKRPIIRGSFAERDLQFKASCGSLPPCDMHSLSLTLTQRTARKAHSPSIALSDSLSLSVRVFKTPCALWKEPEIAQTRESLHFGSTCLECRVLLRRQSLLYIVNGRVSEYICIYIFCVSSMVGCQ